MILIMMMKQEEIKAHSIYKQIKEMQPAFTIVYVD